MVKGFKVLFSKLISALLVIVMLATSNVISPSVYAEDFTEENIETEMDLVTFSEGLSDSVMLGDEHIDEVNDGEIITGDGEVSEGIHIAVSDVKKYRYEEYYIYGCTLTIHTVAPDGDATPITKSNVSKAYSFDLPNGSSLCEDEEYGYTVLSAEGTTADNTAVIKIGEVIWTDIEEAGLSSIYVFYDKNLPEYIATWDESAYTYKTTVSLAINDAKLTEEAFDENTLENDRGLVVMFNSDDVALTSDLSYMDLHYAGDKIADSDGNYYYTGKQVKPNINVFDGNVRLVAGKDYKIAYKNCVKPYVDDKLTEKYGNGWSTQDKVDKTVKNPYALITGIGSYKGLKIAKFYNIVPAQIGNGFGIRAVASIKNTRIVPGRKPIAPKVDVTLQKWNEDKGKYFKLATLKQGRDYKVTYRKVGDTKEISSISGNDIAGAYFAIVSGVTLNDDSKCGGKLETAAQSMARAEYPDDLNYRHLVPFVINDKEKDLTKAVITLNDSAKSVKFTDLDSDRSDKGLDYWEIPSTALEVSINGNALDSSYVKVYIPEDYRKVGKNCPLEIVPTKAGEDAGYYGKYTKYEYDAKKCVVLPSDLEIIGKDINDYDLYLDYEGEKLLTEDLYTYIQKNNSSLVTPNYLAGKFVFKNKDASEIIYNNDSNTGEYTVNFIKGNSGILGEGKYELMGNPEFGYCGSRLMTIKIVKEVEDKPIVLGNGELFIDTDSDGNVIYPSIHLNNVTKTINPEVEIGYSKDLEDNKIELPFIFSLWVNGRRRDLEEGVDYKLVYAGKTANKTGEVAVEFDFIGKYEEVETYKLLLKVNPMTNASNINATLKDISVKGEISLEELLKKAKYNIFEKKSGKALILDEDYEIDTALYEGLAKTKTSDLSAVADPEKIYYMRFVGKAGSGYEGLSVYRALKFNRKLTTHDFKNAFKNVKIAHKGDVSYLERGDFLDKLQIEGLGEFGENKDFYFRPYKMDKHGNPDAAYYGSSGKKKVYLVGSESTNKCSGSLLVTFKVDNIDKELINIEDGGYQYIRSLFSK